MAEEHVERSGEVPHIKGLVLPSEQHGAGRGSAVTVGVFDGVHRGHIHLIDAVKRRAAGAGLRSVVVTFRNHPLSVLRPDFEPEYLCTVDDRVALLGAAGVDAVVALDFDTEMADLPAADFVRLMCDRLEMKALVVGPDFALGHDREGDVDFLARMGAEAGFGVEMVEPLNEGGVRIGSTLVRQALAQGTVSEVSSYLGRNFTLTGTVVKGSGRGGPLGFPTANIEAPEGMAVPGNGIYAVWAHLAGDGERRRLMCATSVGTNPTFDETERTVEAFVLDYDGNLYGSALTLEFVRRLRDEERFDTVEALQNQVERDVTETRAVLSASQ